MRATNHHGAAKGVRRRTKSYKRRIMWCNIPKHVKILQIYTRGLEYSLVSDKYEQCHPFVWCKDFLHDVVHAFVHNKAIDIYRFAYSPDTGPHPCLKEARIIISNARDPKLASRIPGCLDFLNQVENRLKMPRSVVRECSNPPAEYAKAGVFLFQGNMRWLKSPPMLSLYTLLIRIGLVHRLGTPFTETIKALKEKTIKPYQQKDVEWLKECEPALHKIMRLGDKKVFYKRLKDNYPVHINIEQIHNKLGILGYAFDMILYSVRQPVMVPYWHRLR
jgi:hypothetical protein